MKHLSPSPLPAQGGGQGSAAGAASGRGATQHSAPRKRLRLYARLDARFDDRDEDPRASLVNLVDVMLVFACGLLAALAAGSQAALKAPVPVEKGREVERPAAGAQQAGAGYDRVGEVFRDPQTGKLILIEPGAGK